MNNERKVLLIILYFSIVLPVFFFSYASLKSSRDQMKEKIELNLKQYEKLSAESHVDTKALISELHENIDSQKTKYFTAEESYIFKIGQEIRVLFRRNHLTVHNYKVLNQGDSHYMEFSITGTPYNFFNFLKFISINDKYYHIPYLQITKNDKELSILFRIGPSIIE